MKNSTGNLLDFGSINHYLMKACGTQNYNGVDVDRASLWNLTLAISTIALVIITWFLWKVAKQQLGGISKTSKAEFIMKFTNNFFTDTTRMLIMLLEYNALRFAKEAIDIGESKPKTFMYFYTDVDIIKQMHLDPNDLNVLSNRIY